MRQTHNEMFRITNNDSFLKSIACSNDCGLFHLQRIEYTLTELFTLPLHP